MRPSQASRVSKALASQAFHRRRNFSFDFINASPADALDDEVIAQAIQPRQQKKMNW